MIFSEERRILVTGATGGLGRELCRALVEAGAHVLATDIRDEDGAGLAASLAGGPGRLDYARLDLADPDRLGAHAEALLARHGPIDSLVNNAAIYPRADAEAVTAAAIGSVLAVNAVAAAALVRALAPGMKARRFGRILNVASITFDLGFAELSAYVASKAALIGLARVWAREFGPHGITANAISPGAFKTDAEKIHPDPEGYNAFVLSQQSVKRRGVPADFANLALFLLRRESGFITGQTIRVDGGWVTQ